MKSQPILYLNTESRSPLRYVVFQEKGIILILLRHMLKYMCLCNIFTIALGNTHYTYI